MKGCGRRWKDAGVGHQANGQLLSSCSSSFEGREYSLPMPRVGTHLASTRFPRERDTSETHPLPRTLSTWSLVPGEGHMNGNTEPQDSSVGDTPVADPEPQDKRKSQDKLESQGKPEPQVQNPTARDVNPPRQTGGKPSRFKRAVRELKKFMKSKSISAP